MHLAPVAAVAGTRMMAMMTVTGGGPSAPICPPNPQMTGDVMQTVDDPVTPPPAGSTSERPPARKAYMPPIALILEAGLSLIRGYTKHICGLQPLEDAQAGCLLQSLEAMQSPVAAAPQGCPRPRAWSP